MMAQSNQYASMLQRFYHHINRFQYHEATQQLIPSTNVDHASNALADAPDSSSSTNDFIIPDAVSGWWDGLTPSLNLMAACESTYYMMKYLEPQWLSSNVLENMYSKLVSAIEGHAKELGDAIVESSMGKWNTPSTKEHSLSPDESLFYANLFEECSRFFELRLQLISTYKTLANSTTFIDAKALGETLTQVESEYQTFEHPLINILKDVTLHEIQSLKCGIEAELLISTMSSHCSVMKLHTLRQLLKDWRHTIKSAVEDVDDVTSPGGSNCSSSRRSSSVSSNVSSIGNTLNNSSIITTNVARVGRSHSAATAPRALSSSVSSLQRHRSDMSSIDNASQNSMTSSSAAILLQKNKSLDTLNNLPVYSWAQHFYVSLLSKFTLYFYRSLSSYQYADYSGDDSVGLLNLQVSSSGLSWNSMPFVNTVQTFVARSISSSSDNKKATVLIIYKTSYYPSSGYYCPEGPGKENQNSSTGLSTIFCYPEKKRNDDKRVLELVNKTTTDGLTFQFEKRTSYYALSITKFHTLVAFIEEKRSASDKLFVDFMNTMVSNLQHRVVFSKKRSSNSSSTGHHHP